MTPLGEERRLRRDIVWNMAAFAVLGSCGVGLNVLIARAWDAHTLGVFNQTLTLHILLGQIAAFGIQMSVLRRVSALGEENESAANLIASAVAAVLPAAAVVGLIGWSLAEMVGHALDSPETALSMKVIVPGIMLFAINKTLLNAINGLRAMRTFAVLQAARPLLMLSTAAALAFASQSGASLPMMINAVEALLFLTYIATMAHFVPLMRWRPTWDSIRAHWAFGAKATVGGWLAEANTRVDVLIAGAFLSDRDVGIYSAASTLVEGLVQLPTVLRNNVNPLIARYTLNHQRAELRALCSRASRASIGLMMVSCSLVVGTYAMFAQWILGDPAFCEAWWALALACAGLVAGAWMLPLDSILVQAGEPTKQTVFKALSLTVSVVALLALTPVFGITGAGAGVGIAFPISSIVLYLMARRTFS